MSSTDGSDDSEYANLSNEDFVKLLRVHLNDGAWTLGEWLELETRGFEITDSDPDLHAAIARERSRLNAAVQPLIRPFYEQMGVKLKPLQDQLRALMSRTAGDGSAGSHLLRQTDTKVPDYVFPPPAIPEFRPYLSKAPASVIEEIAGVQTAKISEETSRREGQLEVAIESVGVLREIKSEIAEGNRRGWYEWLTLVLVAIAAIASVIALLVH